MAAIYREGFPHMAYSPARPLLRCEQHEMLEDVMSRVRLPLFLIFLALTTEQCVAQFPKPVPDGPLGDVDTAFLTEYTARSKAKAAENPPYVEILGSSLILHHAGQQPDSQRVLPTIYHALKDVTHVPFTLYVRLSPLVGTPLSDEQVGQLQDLNAKIASAEGALQAGGFNDVQLERQMRMLDSSKAFLQSVVVAKGVDKKSVNDFAHKMAPWMLQNADDAGCYQIEAMHAQMMKWKAILSSDEWGHLIAVNKGAHQARYRNVATQYFEWLFHGS